MRARIFFYWIWNSQFARVFRNVDALDAHIARRARAVTARGAMPRPESFGVEEMFGNGNDNVPVKGDFRVRLAAAERREPPVWCTSLIVRRASVI